MFLYMKLAIMYCSNATTPHISPYCCDSSERYDLPSILNLAKSATHMFIINIITMTDASIVFIGSIPPDVFIYELLWFKILMIVTY